MQREEHTELEAKTFSLEVSIYQKRRGAWGKRCALRLNGVPRRLDFIQLLWIMLPKMLLKYQEICKVKCSHTVKCHSSGYQCLWAEALGRANLSVLFICKTNVVSVYYKGNCLWRSWGAMAASERGIFVQKEGQNTFAECPYIMWHHFVVISPLFWRSQNLDEFVCRRKDYISGTKRCQVWSHHFYIFVASWYSTKWSWNVLKHW